ncbi:amidohydrolase [Litchfieldia salsa]|uniref:Aminobenzoyl-glutamate utilization protein B n=1 Tax=Litchfieldia salsa TaxID=930152 RepID=A0A1H0RUB9_9BACI|nr:amidohydrolase [Litchfieldia salsa]SDP32985.1 aminobenzoyl-glutamate utilization protein B [Litchfieldia salsa]
MSKQTLLDWIQRHEFRFTDIARQIWDNPQVAYEETFASNLQMATLKEVGFKITAGVGGVPTAFIAEYGIGSPIIGILGEYDALPGLSQEVSVVQEEVVPNGPGHGCGHNLLGTAGVEAIIALKEIMDIEDLKGTIRYYGCPAEEVLSGKTFMARAGVFDDLDCALTWHPGTANFSVNMSTQAMVSIKYHFKGITAHAAGAPEAGRSALDAVELMNVGSNYLREHIPEGSRIHYVITNGGLAPNIVPDHASVWYYLRATTKDEVDDILRRVHNIAQGAALMTETEVHHEILAFAYDTLPNDVLNNLMYENMKLAGSPLFTDEEYIFARNILETVDPKVVKNSKKLFGNPVDDLLPTGYYYYPQLKGTTMAGSTDVGDVSWIVPIGQVMTTCAPVGVQAHSWQATACYGSSIGYKGMHLAAKTMALSMYDLLLQSEVLVNAKKEFERNCGGKQYTPAIPSDVMPPVPTKLNRKKLVSLR